MTQIDFYIIGEQSTKNNNQLVCQLCEKALQKHMNVLVHVDSEAHAWALDEQLWTFKPESFLPHTIAAPANDSANTQDRLDSAFFMPILINHRDTIPNGYDNFLINTNNSVPLFFSRFERVAEIVGKTDEEKSAGRQRYRFYKERGYRLNKYDI